jgi:hypothetical protein
MLALAALAPAAGAALAACGPGGTGSDGPDPLIELAARARADAALAAAVAAATPALGGRLDPVRAARTEHATALDAEVVRLDPARASSAPAAPPAPPASSPTLAQVGEALRQSATAAKALVATLPAQRVGLVASVAACCATYAEVLS